MIKMLKTMLLGQLSRKNFDDKEDFYDWYWNQIPDDEYPGETLWDCWDTFKWILSLGELRSNIEIRRLLKKGKREYGYSKIFRKYGYFINTKKGGVLFVPEDKIFEYGYSCLGDRV
jgi:hypothetical protein